MMTDQTWLGIAWWIYAGTVVVGVAGAAFLAGRWTERRANIVRALGYPRGSTEAAKLGLRPEYDDRGVTPAEAARRARIRIEAVVDPDVIEYPGPLPAGMRFVPNVKGVHVVETPELADDFDPPSALLRPDEPAASVSDLKPSTARVPRRTVEEIESTPPDDEPITRTVARRPVIGRDPEGRLAYQPGGMLERRSRDPYGRDLGE